MAELKEKLFSEFAPVSTEEWMAKITADLKGVPFEKKLVWKTGEGFNVNPFYRAEDIEGLKTTESLPGEFPYVRGTKKDNDWKVRQNIEVTCFKGSNVFSVYVASLNDEAKRRHTLIQDVKGFFISTFETGDFDVLAHLPIVVLSVWN